MFVDRSTNLQELHVAFIAPPNHLQSTFRSLSITSDVHLVSALCSLIHSPAPRPVSRASSLRHFPWRGEK